MSTFAQTAATSQTLSVAAMEEASRMGQREADLDHLLLALTISGQPAGHALRSLGVSIEATREAIAEQRTRQLRCIGVEATIPRGERITYDETGGYTWSKRARDVIARSAGGKNSGDAGAVLRALLDEPSGLIEELLAHLGISCAAVIQRLGETENRPPPSVPARRGGALGFTDAFVPAPVENVWALLASPARMSDWDPLVARVSVPDPSEHAGPGRTWLTFQGTKRPDGKPRRVRKNFERRRVERVVADDNDSIAWRFSYPDAAHSNPIRLAITLSPATGGTQLGMTLDWPRRTGWRRTVALPLSPFRRFAAWIWLRQLGEGISRVFR